MTGSPDSPVDHNDIPASYHSDHLSAKQRILVVEDETAVARGIQYALEQEGWDVTVARNATAALDYMNHHIPDLAVLDVRLPDMNGFDLCRTIRRHHTFPVLFLTARDDLTDKVLGLELGADDYMTKPFAVRELTTRIRALLRRAYGEFAPVNAPRHPESPGDPHQTALLHIHDLDIDIPRRRVSRNGQRIDLTAIEFDLLRVLATHPGVVYTREALLREVWDYDGYFGDPRTVNVHISHLREKIEADPTHPLILTERGVGYKFADHAS